MKHLPKGMTVVASGHTADDIDRQIYSKFAKQTIPRAYLIDKDGKVVDFAVGYDAEHFDAMCSKAMELL